MIDRERFLGIDFGARRIGLAVSEGSLASPLRILQVKGQRAAIKEIARLCQKEKVKKVVLGLPQGPQEEKVLRFAQILGGETGAEIIFWDEVLTTAQALDKMVQSGRSRTKRRHLDDVVAAIILQEYLDSRWIKKQSV